MMALHTHFYIYFMVKSKQNSLSLLIRIKVSGMDSGELSDIVKVNEAESYRVDKQQIQIFEKYSSRLNSDQRGLGSLMTGGHYRETKVADVRDRPLCGKIRTKTV